MSYNNYNRGYAEPTMTSADYMTRTYRWMALGLLITFAAAFVTATTPLFYVVNSLYLLFTIAETIMLMAGGMSLYDSLITTFGSVGTGGLSNYSDSMGHFDSTYLRMVVTGFMFLCGVNFNLYYLSAKHGIKVLLKDSEFRVYFLIFAISSLFIFAMLMISGQYESSGSALSDSVFQVSSILTTT